MSEFKGELTPAPLEGGNIGSPAKRTLTITIGRGSILNVVLVLLIIAAAFQAYVLYGLQGKVKNGLKLAPAASAASSVPSSPANLPSMVGGC